MLSGRTLAQHVLRLVDSIPSTPPNLDSHSSICSSPPTHTHIHILVLNNTQGLAHTRQAHCIFLDLQYSGVGSQCNQDAHWQRCYPQLREASVPLTKLMSMFRTWHTIITSPQAGEHPILATVTENPHHNPRYEDSNRKSQSHPTIDDQLSPRQDLPDGGHRTLAAFLYYQLASLALRSDDIRQNHSINNFSFQDGQICLKTAVEHSFCQRGIKKK